MAVNGVEIKVGQKWRVSGFSKAAVVIENRRDDHFKHVLAWHDQVAGVLSMVVDDNGYPLGGGATGELIELIEDAPAPAQIDVNELAAETLQSLGWHFVGNCWVQENTVDAKAPSQYLSHPLYPVVVKAIEQAMFGKGERHGGNATPFLEQPWVHYAKMHGRGFLTGQAAKKLEEAASKRTGEAFETEVLGAMVYAGMAVLFERGEVK